MKKKDLLAFFKKRFTERENIGAGDWSFTLSKEGKKGYLKVTPSLRFHPPMQYIDHYMSMSPSWFAELVCEVVGDDDVVDRFISHTYPRVYKPENGDVKEYHLEESLPRIYEWYEEHSKPEVIAAELNRIYGYGLDIGPGLKTHFFLCCVLKGDVELLENELKLRLAGTSKQPPFFNEMFFTNAVRIAKEYRNGVRVCPVDFN